VDHTVGLANCFAELSSIGTFGVRHGSDSEIRGDLSALMAAHSVSYDE
jgi:hypothetical protein